MYCPYSGFLFWYLDAIRRHLSSLMFANGRLKYRFSFARDSYKGFLLHHGSFSYTLLIRKLQKVFFICRFHGYLQLSKREQKGSKTLQETTPSCLKKLWFFTQQAIGKVSASTMLTDATDDITAWTDLMNLDAKKSAKHWNIRFLRNAKLTRYKSGQHQFPYIYAIVP